MNDKIVIAQLDLNFDALVQSSVEASDAIIKLKNEQKKLTDEGKKASAEYVKNEVALKNLTAAYNQNVKVMTASVKAAQDLETREKALKAAFDMEVVSVDTARERNKLLTELRNSVNVTTAEGVEELKRLNAELDKNNEFIKENVDAYTKQKINIGNYKDSIIEAANELNIFNGGLGAFIARAEQAGGAGNLLGNTFKTVTSGILSMTKATLAFIATPIGAIIAALVLVFLAVKNAMNRSEEATNKLKVVFAAFSGVINALMKVLEPLGAFLIDGIVAGFELVGEAAEAAAKIVSSALSFFGFDEAAAALDNLTESVKGAAREAMALEKMQQDLTVSMRKAKVATIDYEKEQERLKKIMEDGTRTTTERLAANDQLAASLKKQITEELALAKTALEIVNRRIKAEGERTELLDAQADALLKIAEIEKRIGVAQFDQLKVANELRKADADARKAAAEAAAAARLRELKALIDLFEAQRGYRAKNRSDELEEEETAMRKRLKLLDEEFRLGVKSKTEYDAERKKLTEAFLKEQAETAVYYAQKEVDEFIKSNVSKIDADKFLTEQIVAEEKIRFESLAKARRDFEDIRLSEGVISQEEYNANINAINDENIAKLAELDAQRKAAKKEADLIDLENRRATEDLIFEEDLARTLERLEQQRQVEVLAAEKNGADKAKINEKYAAMEAAVRKKYEVAKVDAMQQGLAKAGELLSSFGVKNKNVAIALATADALLSATKAFASQLVAGDPSSLGRAIGAGALALAQGMANVSQIAKTDTKFEKGGLFEIGGKRHSEGGTKFQGSDGTRFEAEKGELIGVMSRKAAKAFLAFNNAHTPGSSSTSYAANGGIISRSFQSNDSNFEEFYTMVIDAVTAMPPPVVLVEDIRTGVARTVEVEEGATFG